MSRREALAGIVVLPALAALGTASADAFGKKTKAALQYQDYPHGTQRCANCVVFHAGKTASAEGTCSLVQGSISPHGWCRVFVAKAK